MNTYNDDDWDDLDLGDEGFEDEVPEGPSKTQVKKQMHQLRDLGGELCELNKDQLKKLDLPENLFEAIREMQRITSFGAKRRQLQYIGKLMRQVDPAPIIAQLDVWKGVSNQHNAYLHRLERLREKLMDNDDALNDLFADYPELDIQRLRTLVRNARKEREAAKPPKNYREIFQVLKETIPESM